MARDLMAALKASLPTNHLPDAAYAFAPYNKPVMSRAEAAETLRATDGWIMAKGEAWDLHVRDIGAGMCRIELEPRFPESTHESQTGTSAQEGEGNWEYRMRHAHGTRWSDWSTREPPPTPGWVVEKQWVQHDITPVETQERTP